MRSLWVKRIDKLKIEARKLNVEAYLCLSPSNIHYFTGCSDAGKLSYGFLIPLGGGEPTIFTPEMGAVQLASLLPKQIRIETVKLGSNPAKEISREIGRFKSVAFDDFSYSGVRKIMGEAGEVRFEAHPEIPQKLRLVKDEAEIELIKKAIILVRRGVEAAEEAIKPGVAEYEVAAEAEYAMRSKGLEFYAFETIVTSGPRSAYPHGFVSQRKIRNGETVVVDIGAKVQGYCADITRTFVVGKPRREILTAYRAVLEAQEKVLTYVKPGIKGFEADMVAREHLDRLGFKGTFIHALGHGVGLEVHEPPRLAPQSEDILVENSVFTVEPGIYVKGKFGVRIEDMVLLGKEKAKVLTAKVKKLEV